MRQYNTVTFNQNLKVNMFSVKHWKNISRIITLCCADDGKPKRVHINTELNYIACHYHIESLLQRQALAETSKIIG